MLVCNCFIVKGFYWQHVVRYHVKMDKLLQKETKVTKVPDDTYGERERESQMYWHFNNLDVALLWHFVAHL